MPISRSTMKEFTNDPTLAMQEISDLFEKRLAMIQNDLNFLKREENNIPASSSFMSCNSTISQLQKHRDLVIQSLKKVLSEQISSFKNALKVHSDNVEQRKKRVTKYGQGLDLLKAGSSSTTTMHTNNISTDATRNNSGLAGYAMFSVKQNFESESIGIHSELRNRKNPTTVENINYDNNSNNKLKVNEKATDSYSKFKKNDDRNIYHSNSNKHQNFSQVQQMQEYKSKPKDTTRLRNAEKVEASIVQVVNVY